MTTLQTVYRIFSLFEPQLKRHNRTIPATHFLPHLTGSRMTTIKARRALGIESRKIAGRFCWIFPKLQRARTTKLDIMGSPTPAVTPESILTNAIQRLGFKPPGERNRKKVAPAKEYLMRELRANHYQMHSVEILARLKRLKLPRAAVYKAKTSLGILSVRQLDRSMHWIWIPEEVTGWLREFMAQERYIPVATVTEAAAKKGWSQEVLDQARKKVGGITTGAKDGVLYWTDINYRPPASSQEVSPLEEAI